jgi:hypothetical protein
MPGEGGGRMVRMDPPARARLLACSGPKEAWYTLKGLLRRKDVAVVLITNVAVVDAWAWTGFSVLPAENGTQ